MSNFKKIIILFIVLVVLGGGYAIYSERENLFSKRKKDCVPYNLLVNKEKGAVKITWSTKDSCTGVVKFGTDIEDLSYWLYSQKDSEVSYVLIDTQKYKEINYFVIISNGILYGLDGKVIPIN
jgi:hypothetical protein